MSNNWRNLLHCVILFCTSPGIQGEEQKAFVMRGKVNAQPPRSGKPIRWNREPRDNVFTASSILSSLLPPQFYSRTGGLGEGAALNVGKETRRRHLCAGCTPAAPWH